MEDAASRSRLFSRNLILIGGLLLYACAFATLLRNKSFDVVAAVVVLVVFGIALPLIAWIATRRAVPLSISNKPRASEIIVLSAYIVALSLYLIGGPQWVDQHLPSSWIDSLRVKSLISLAKKLVVFVAFPFAIFRFGFGYRIRDFGIQREGLRALRRSHLPVVLAVGAALLAFQFFVSSGGAAFRNGHFTTSQLLVGLPLCFIWLLLEVGLVEGSVATGSCVQVRDKRHRADVPDFWFGARSRFYFSAGWRIRRTRPASKSARRGRLFRRYSRNKWNHIRCNLGANEKSLYRHAHSCCWRPPAEPRQLRPNMVLNGSCRTTPTVIRNVV